MFPDPSTSPAHYTKVLFIGDPKVVAAVDVDVPSWITGFSRVVHLAMVGPDWYNPEWEAALIQFRGFSPFVKTLRMEHIAFPLSHLSPLILSFPLLEDLSVTDCYRVDDSRSDIDEASFSVQLSNLPIHIRPLALLLCGIGYALRWLLLLPGIRSNRLWEVILARACEEDISPTMTLVEMCPHTLETIDITFNDMYGMSISNLRPQGSNFFFQLIRCRPRSTSRIQQSSETRFFGPDH